MAIIYFTMLFGLIHGGLLVAAWRAAHRLATLRPAPPSPSAWPPVRIILPFAGSSNMRHLSLDDLAAQDYPDYDIHLACHAADESACVLAQVWMQKQSARGGPQVRLARAATARFCGQKNQNLLAALAAPGPADVVLVFTDADYRRPADWLQRLVAPIPAGQAAVTSGYYFAAAGTRWRDALRPVTALLLFLVQQVAALRQTWGGATAIPRRLFDELNIADLWSTNIVDDVALAAHLRQARIPITVVNSPALLAPVGDSSDFDWTEWFTRQLAYIRAIQPGVWVGLGIGFLLLAAGLLWMVGSLVCAKTASPAFWIAALDGVLLMSFGLRLRALHPHPGSRRAWLMAFWGFILAAPICHFRTVFSRTIRWQGIRYRVGRGGRVLSTSAMPARPPEARPESTRPRPG